MINMQSSVITNKEALEFIEKVKMLINEIPDLKSPDEKQYIHS